MRGPSFHALRGTAALHPVVILVPVEEGCDAFIMQPDQAGLSHLPLRGVRLDRLAHLTSSSFPTRESRLTMSVSGPKCHLHRTLAALWTDVVKPVFQFLGLRVCCNGSGIMLSLDLFSPDMCWKCTASPPLVSYG
jgi:hypothetical protein